MNGADLAAEAGGVVVVGGVLVGAASWALKAWLRQEFDKVRRDTSQLQRNGGSTVADSSKIAADSSLRQEKALADHMIDSAKVHASQDAKIEVLYKLLIPMR